MKKPYAFLTILFISVMVMAQAPQRMSYQSVIRGADNNLITNNEIGMQISILQGSSEGVAVYIERHFPSTNDNGLVSLEIGNGTVVSGSFDNIDWGSDIFFIKTETDLLGGANYTITGVSQVLSVPYAFHAKTSETLTGELEEADPLFTASPAHGIQDSDILNWNEAYNWGDNSDAGYLVEETQTLADVLVLGNDANDSRIKNIGDPVEDQDAVPKAYVDLLEEKVDALLAYYESLENLPLTSTSDISDITSTTATGGGNVINDGGSDIMARGLVWHTEEMPTLASNVGYTDDGSDLGQFVSVLIGLSPATTYFVRAYATNNAGTAYGNQREFQTIGDNGENDIIYGDGVTDIDGNEYVTVIISDQEWMAENLRVTKYNNGDAIPTGLGDIDWEFTTSGAYAVFDHNHWTADGINSPEEMVAAYGKLYNWFTVDDPRGLCPEGWSVPSDDHWIELVNNVVNQGYPNESGNLNGAGNALKSCRQVGSPLGGECDVSVHPRWNSHSTHYGLDAFGFSALPAGERSYEGTFNSFGYLGNWWSTTEFTEYDNMIAFSPKINNSNSKIRLSSHVKTSGFSVRCLRDNAGPTSYTLNLEVNPSGAGSATGAGVYEISEEIIITAVANEGWEFVNWTGGTEYLADANAANTIVTMPADDITLIANFEQEESGWPRDTQTQVVDVTNPKTGKTWMDRNLGASRAATSSTDEESYGDLYQWGRAADGHQKRTSGTTSTRSMSDTPGHGDFILASSDPYDWRSPQNDNLWQGVNGVNNPCPPGYRLPTLAELDAERLSWSSNNAAGAFASPLKLPVAGYRLLSGGSLYEVGSAGSYWSSTVDGSYSRYLFFYSSGAGMYCDYRAYGLSVRCFKD